MIILLAGGSKNGKDYLANELHRWLNWPIHHFADAMKADLGKALGVNFDLVKDSKIYESTTFRDVLAAACECAKKIQPDIWVKPFIGRKNIIIADHRFKIEKDLLPNSYVIKVDRGIAPNKHDGDVDDLEYDFLFDGNNYGDLTRTLGMLLFD